MPKFLNHLQLGEGINLSLGTSTGTKIGTASSEKLSFYGVTPVVQTGSTADIKDALTSYGLLVGTSATPLDLDGGTLNCGSLIASGAADVDVLKVITSATNSVAIGSYSASPFGCYIQSQDYRGAWVATYPLILQPSGSNVGIGTTSPSYKLVVKDGTAGFAFDAINQYFGTTFGTGGGYKLFAEAPGSSTGTSFESGASARGDSTKNAFVFRIGATEVMRIDGDYSGHTAGNVGIGAVTPGNLLHINSAATPATSQFRTTANGLGSLSMLNYSADNVSLGFDVDFASSGWVARHSSIGVLYKLSGKLEFYGSSGNTVGGTATLNPYFTIDLSNGKTGIGTQSPGANLSIVGSVASNQVGQHIYNTSASGYSALRLGTDSIAAAGTAIHHFNGSWSGSDAYAPNSSNYGSFGAGGTSISASAGNIRLYTGGVTSTEERLRIADSLITFYVPISATSIVGGVISTSNTTNTTVATNSNSGNQHNISTTSSFTLGVPSNGSDSKVMTFRIKNTSGGNVTVDISSSSFRRFNYIESAYVIPTSKSIYLRMIYNSTETKWDIIDYAEET